MSQALYRKWRPRLWEQVVGQDHVIKTIQNAIRSERIGHAYLFAGPRGTGKTTTARLLAKAVNCQAENVADRPCDECEHCKAVNDSRFLDLIEIDAASNTSVDDVRDLRDKINFSPSQGDYKVYIIDEVHMLSTAAFNALLKTLEEPPPHAIFVLATTEVHKIPATVLSRCQRHEFRRIPVNDIVIHLRQMAQQENLDVEDDALVLIARQSTGSLRDAISLLDQLASTGDHITLDIAQMVLGTATNQSVVALVEAMIEKDAAAGLNCIHLALDNGSDPRQFARQIVEYLRNLMLIRLGNADQVDVTHEMRAQMAQHAQAFSHFALLEAIRLFNTAASEGRLGWHPGLLLELALAEIVEEKPQMQVVQQVAAPQQPVQPQAVPQKAAAEVSITDEDAQPHLEADAQAPAAPASAAAGVDIQEVLRNWDRIKSLIKKHRGQTVGLLNSCKPLSLKDGLLTLGFASDVLKDKMEGDENLALTRQAISHVLGGDIEVTCVVMDKNISIDLTDAESGGGMVSEALNLGGKIKSKE